ncbi:membrane lipoprotein lipid attachment site-containing protein [Cytobacillus oceanisediminis]|uniref:membrane lipoprotein lipid attachment site-containing protein n=1 Tax=Cytobacillus oceanisediminis TaxID=665099 RepID=UPI001FB1F64B|nr:membrane lipoprotein lipid attachment site-containing protein [Cytobacillus oceanisediminis]UOE53529.1 membrane lipoprotein lipid attachment site-containing protein [Cytobacillus oceanisediminis]
MKKYAFIISLILILAGCTPSLSGEDKSEGRKATVTSENSEAQEKQTEKVPKQQEQAVEPTKAVTEEEKNIFKETVNTHLNGVALLAEEQVKMYEKYVLLNGLTGVKQTDIADTQNRLNDIFQRLQVVRNLKVPEDQALIQDFNDTLLKADKLHLALQKVQTPMSNNFVAQLNVILENDIGLARQELYTKIGYESTDASFELPEEERNKINSDEYDPNVPFSDQRETIYGNMECPPPTYCEDTGE